MLPKYTIKSFSEYNVMNDDIDSDPGKWRIKRNKQNLNIHFIGTIAYIKSLIKFVQNIIVMHMKIIIPLLYCLIWSCLSALCITCTNEIFILQQFMYQYHLSVCEIGTIILLYFKFSSLNLPVTFCKSMIGNVEKAYTVIYSFFRTLIWLLLFVLLSKYWWWYLANLLPFAKYKHNNYTSD